MNKMYAFFFALFFISCTTKIRFIGKALPPTKTIEVFVTEKSIQHSFDFIGKGYIRSFGAPNPTKIQQKAEILGLKKGADAVLITDYSIPTIGRMDNTGIYVIDSNAHGMMTNLVSPATPAVYSGYHIYYLKYSSR